MSEGAEVPAEDGPFDIDWTFDILVDNRPKGLGLVIWTKYSDCKRLYCIVNMPMPENNLIIK